MSEVEAEIHHLTANGLEFAYLAAGPERTDAPLVLVLHGFPDTAESFQPLLTALAGAGVRAAAVYQRGYAPSQLAPDGDYSPLTLGRDVLALIEHFGVEQAWLVGHDWGAVAAYAAAAMRPDRVAGVVAASMPHLRRYLLRLSRGQLRASRYMLRFQLPGAERALARDGFAALDALVRDWSPGWTPPEDWLQRVHAAFAERPRLRAALRYYRALPGALLRGESWSFLLRPMQVPVRLIYGEHDGCMLASGFRGQEHLFAAGFDLVKLPECGHFPHLEAPAAFESLVLSAVTQGIRRSEPERKRA
jgi:Predicted hydrolases or acyltransferases (alpha/beta hydrolase superfamily)